MEISLTSTLKNIIDTMDTEVMAAEKVNLLIEIKTVKSELQSVYNNYEYAEDPLMIDYYTYQIKAYETKFEYLIKRAKALGVTNI